MLVTPVTFAPGLKLPSRNLLTELRPRLLANGMDSARAATALKRRLRWDPIHTAKRDQQVIMLPPIVLKMVNKHLAELSRKYTAIRKGDPRAVAIAEELSQVTTVRDEIQKIWEKLGRSSSSPRSLPSESPTVETLLRQMDELAHQFAETPREDPLKSEIANEITRLSFLADALSKSRNSQ